MGVAGSEESLPLIAAVEAGGTKFNVAVARAVDAPLAETRLATAGPEATLAEVVAFLGTCEAEHGPIDAVGLAAFGPLRLDRAAADFGCILPSPKAQWSNVDLAGRIARGRPVAVDTDVNAAALAEARWGAGRGAADLAYVTIGTGVGVGLVLDGRPRHGLLHPEAGHMALRRAAGDTFAGTCPFHGDCAEGLISGPALAARLGAPLTAGGPLAEIDRFCDQAGQLCATIVLLTSVERIVIGGGVMTGLPVHAAIEDRMRHWLGGYLDLGCAAGSFVVPPGLGPRSGVAGAFALAADLLAGGDAP